MTDTAKEEKLREEIKLTSVVLACDLNDNYVDFIPIVIDRWLKLNIKPVCLLIANSLPSNLSSYKDYIVLFPPLTTKDKKEIKTPFIAQNIRLLYPALVKTDGGVIISDIDMIPLNKSYFDRSYPHDKITNLRGNILADYEEIVMCYNVAHPNVWAKLFGIKTIDDIKETLIDWYSKCDYSGDHGGSGWTFDQCELYRRYQKDKDMFNFLDDRTLGFQRLPIIYNLTLAKAINRSIRINYYTDYHMPKPYNINKDVTDYILSLLQ